jgi:hypothetical protein
VQSKKALIRKLAIAAACVVGVGLIGVILTLLIAHGKEKELWEQARREQAGAAEEARSYLAELAQSIDGTPVDPSVVAEIQSDYFETATERKRFVWGVGDQGEFLFGVPHEAFARLNEHWDAQQDRLRAPGLFVDRQDFLRQLVHASGDLEGRVFELRLDEEGFDPIELRERIRYQARRGDAGWLTLSAPLRSAEGSALGSLYLQLEAPRPRSLPHVEKFLGGFGAASGLSFAFLWFLLPTWVFVDARERGMPRGPLWSFLVLISLFLGLVVYLIARPEQPAPLSCPGCSREVDAAAFCPHCGHDLARAYCSACRYPLKPEWSFCPSCRTEIGPREGSASELLPEQG